MREALDEARAALTTSDVPIGAIVVDSTGTVLGRGRNRREADLDPTAHAEVLALREAAVSRGTWRLDGCALVVTLEPCTMCAGAVVLSRVERLVFGAWDDKAGGGGSLWDGGRGPPPHHPPHGPRGGPAPEAPRPSPGVFSPPPARGPGRGPRAGARRADPCVLRRPPDPGDRSLRAGAGSGTLVRGGVSERPKEHASKACVGATPPWVQIPPPPPSVSADMRPA